MNIEIGYWGIPAAITILSFVFFTWWSRPDGNSYGYAAAGQGAVALVGCLGIIILSLGSWLVYFIIV